jgi:hypothetical protein
MSHPFERRRAIVRTQRPLLPFIVPASILTALGIMVTESRPVLRATVVLAAWLLSFAIEKLRSRWWRTRRRDVRAGGAGLELGGRLVLSRAWAQGSVVERPDMVVARVEGLPGAFEIVVGSVAEGRELVEAMRLDAPRKSAQFTFRDAHECRALVDGAVYAVMMAAALVGVGGGGLMRVAFAVFVVTSAIAALVIVIFGSSRIDVTVGTDGVRLHRAPWRVRFVPYAALNGVDLGNRRLTMRIRGERAVHASFGATANAYTAGGAEDARAFVARVEENLVHHRARANSAVRGLSRGGRAPTIWLRDLASLSRATYRTPAVAHDALWQIVEDPSADASERAGAALLLRPTLDVAARADLARIAESSAHPSLPPLLDAIASANEAATRRAVERMAKREDQSMTWRRRFQRRRRASRTPGRARRRRPRPRRARGACPRRP